jgi:hypothetical protein
MNDQASRCFAQDAEIDRLFGERYFGCPCVVCLRGAVYLNADFIARCCVIREAKLEKGASLFWRAPSALTA